MADLVNHPPHYVAANGLEAIDVIDAFGLDYHLGNAVKYILRAGKKGDPVTDLQKALWYLQRAVRHRQAAATFQPLAAWVAQTPASPATRPEGPKRPAGPAAR